MEPPRITSIDAASSGPAPDGSIRAESWPISPLVFRTQNGGENTTFGDADFGWYGILLGNAAKLGTVWGVVTMLLIGAVLLALAVGVQRKLVDTNWDPAPGRPKLTAGAPVSGAVTVGRSYPKIPAPSGAPVPPPPPE